MKLLLYCTKAKPMLRIAKEEFKGQSRARCYGKKETKYFTQYIEEEMYEANGKIVAECDFEVEKIFEDNLEDARDGYLEHFYTLESYDDFDEGQKVLLKESCLQKHELSNYLGFENGYAIRIKNLHIFDKPRELDYFYTECNRNSLAVQIDRKWYRPISNAPQNMMYAKRPLQEDAIIISIKPEWLCKILNGEKTIEVRKKVLKEMLL